MTLDKAIQHCQEKVQEQAKNGCYSCVEEYHQLAEWLKELRVFKSKKGRWLRMSDLSEQEDDRYECSYCGNVVHHKNKMNLYIFNSWCGRCGSDNRRKIEVNL